MSDEFETIKVAPGPRATPGKVVLTERHAAHPDGEVFLAAPNAGRPAREPIEVARTPAVLSGLRDGTLVEARSKKAATQANEKLQQNTTLGEASDADADVVAPTGTLTSAGGAGGGAAPATAKPRSGTGRQSEG